MTEPIIHNLLDIDFYKMTMQQVVFHQYPSAKVSYDFRCRNKGVGLAYLEQDVRRELDHLGDLRFTKEDIDYLSTISFMKPSYLDFLRDFKLNPSDVEVKTSGSDLSIQINDKYWLYTILYEIYVLAIVNQLHFRPYDKESVREEGQIRLDNKISLIKDFPQLKISEFGTRRRFSREWQDHVLGELLAKVPSNIVGTSNVNLARKYGIKAHGTVAHEYFSAHMGLVEDLSQAQKRALHVWLQEYDSDLGTALTDTFTTNAFWQDFGRVLATEFSGLRHDSGCPFSFGRSAIEHYKKLGIDPRTKFLIYSDGLTIRKAIEIWKHFAGDIGLAFGLGTHLTNDMSEYFSALNIVMKLVKCNGVNCVKLSDNIGKAIGDPEMIDVMKDIYGIKG